MEKKIATPIEVLGKDFPEEFGTYLCYCRKLRFADKPDYQYLRGLFKTVMTREEYEYDYKYDWTILAQERKQ